MLKKIKIYSSVLIIVFIASHGYCGFEFKEFNGDENDPSEIINYLDKYVNEYLKKYDSNTPMSTQREQSKLKKEIILGEK